MTADAAVPAHTALGGDQFLSEIRTTARLQHPLVPSLLDSGEADGLLCYVMPAVTGETLQRTAGHAGSGADGCRQERRRRAVQAQEVANRRPSLRARSGRIFNQWCIQRIMSPPRPKWRHGPSGGSRVVYFTGVIIASNGG